jgi:hypothetical protein
MPKAGRTTHFRTQMFLEINPLGQSAWEWYSKGITAPMDSFEKDLPVMSAMFASIKLNATQMQKVADARNFQTQRFTEQWVAQYQQNMQATAKQWQKDQEARNANWQQQHDETQRQYDITNQQTADALLERSRNFDDQIEWARGTSDFVDTANGNRTVGNYKEVDLDQLYNANMNPDTTVRIPLKDEIDPLPAR